MKVSIGAALLAAIALAASACGSSHGIGSPPGSVSESRVIEGGTVRCTATVVTTPVGAGHELGNARVAFVFSNLTKHQALLQHGSQEGSAVVTSPDGTTYDPLWELEHGPGDVVGSTPIAPGATTKGEVFLPRVSWEGPLSITPSCAGSRLPPVRVAVTSPGLPTNTRRAVTEVVAATGHLLDHCRPHTPGVPVIGRIEPPSGDALPFRARCSVLLRRERGFYVAQMLVVTPPDLRGVHVLPTYEQLRAPFAFNHTREVVAWKFVVTRSGATPIANIVGTTTLPHGTVWYWRWTSAGAKDVSPGRCGGSEGSSDPNGPQVKFISACHA
jgi:hypothetical protein